jgi:hypothetical protein
VRGTLRVKRFLDQERRREFPGARIDRGINGAYR